MALASSRSGLKSPIPKSFARSLMITDKIELRTYKMNIELEKA